MKVYKYFSAHFFNEPKLKHRNGPRPPLFEKQKQTLKLLRIFAILVSSRKSQIISVCIFNIFNFFSMLHFIFHSVVSRRTFYKVDPICSEISKVKELIFFSHRGFLEKYFQIREEQQSKIV